MALSTIKPTITPDTVRQDAAGTMGFVQAFIAGMPGAETVSLAEFMAHLAHAQENTLGLEALTRTMQSVPAAK